MDIKTSVIEKHDDRRGALIIFLKKRGLKKRNKTFGQVYFVTFDKKGTVRGNHYHKKMREWFGIINGILKVNLKDVKTGKTKEIILDSGHNKYIRLEIGPYIYHSFKSLTKKAQLLNYTDREWSNTDTYRSK